MQHVLLREIHCPLFIFFLKCFSLFFWCSVVIWDIMPLWTGLCGPTSRLNITWRRLVTRAWTSLRTQWTVWTSVVTGSASWKCTPPPSARPSNLSSSHIWEMRSFFYKASPTHPRTYVPTYTHNSNHTVTQCLVKLDFWIRNHSNMLILCLRNNVETVIIFVETMLHHF